MIYKKCKTVRCRLCNIRFFCLFRVCLHIWTVCYLSSERRIGFIEMCKMLMLSNWRQELRFKNIRKIEGCLKTPRVKSPGLPEKKKKIKMAKEIIGSIIIAFTFFSLIVVLFGTLVHVCRLLLCNYRAGAGAGAGCMRLWLSITGVGRLS